ncbi:MAG TPA: LPS export ABC transporter periplasmic protein LptC [Dongiaceae bacterium]|nr:LPS export ABC transporter periplasmic protein LptC [Dongiaceae bacterium]
MASPSDNLPGPPVSTPDAAPGLGGLRKIAPRSTSQVRRKVRRGASVRVLKIALPLVVLVSLGYVGYWWLQSRGTVVDATLIQNVPDDAGKAEVTVQDVKYDGRDDKGRPFSITADSASHVDGDDRHISLKKPLADITMSSGAYVALMANDGLLDRDSDIITLNGDVTLFHDNGLSFQTDSATINLKDKTAEGSDTVEGQNGDGELVSQGFRVLDDGDTVLFTGKAYMKIYPKQKNQAGQGG